MAAQPNVGNVIDFAGEGLVDLLAEGDVEPPEPELRRKVAIVGYTATRADAPWGDPEWDVIPCNDLHKQIPELALQATAWQNLHRWPDIAHDVEHVEWLKSVPFPVLLFPETIEDAAADGHVFPTAHPFPWREIVSVFRGQLRGHDYFTNSIAWMIAFTVARFQQAGIEDGEIALYGIDLSQETEYRLERCCVEYWLGVAEGAGYTVTIPRTSDILMSAGLYGVDAGMHAMAAKMRDRLDELTAKRNDSAAMIEQIRSQLEVQRYHHYAIEGALENTQYVVRNLYQQPGNVRGEVQAAESEPEVA